MHSPSDGSSRSTSENSKSDRTDQLTRFANKYQLSAAQPKLYMNASPPNPPSEVGRVEGFPALAGLQLTDADLAALRGKASWPSNGVATASISNCDFAAIIARL